MKIAFFSDAYLDLLGGITSTINAQKTALKRDGHELVIFSTAYPKKIRERHSLEEQKIFPVPSCRFFLRGLTPVARNTRYLEKWLLEKHPELRTFDIFYVHYEAGLSIAAVRLAQKLNIPVVQVMHGREDMGESNIVPWGFRDLVAIGLNFAHGWFLPHGQKIPRDNYLAETFAKAKMWELMVAQANAADLVLTPSQHFQKKLKHYGVKKPIKVFPNGLADKYFPEEAQTKVLRPGETLKMIWHSRLSSEKRLLPFLKALTLLRGSFRLEVFGEGPDLVLAQSFVKRHKLPVHFHGQVRFDELKPYLTDAHLDVLVSYNFDTFGMTLIEAEAFATPVLICDPDLAEIVPKETFLLAKNASPSAIADELNMLIERPEKLKKMSEKMLAVREEVLISRRIKILEKYLDELM